MDVNHLPMKYRYSDMPSFQPENSLLTLEEQERGALADMFACEPTVAVDDMVSMSGLPPEGLNLKEMLADLEVDMIRQALEAQTGVVARAADMLGMRRTTLVEKMRKYGLSKEALR